MKITGKYNSATIFTDNIDEASLSQLYNMLNIPCFAHSKIAIMPDVHMGKGSVVGFTMTFNSAINPNVVGVDIGCGIVGYKLGKREVDLPALDEFIRAKIPAGSAVHEKLQRKYVKDNPEYTRLIRKVAPEKHRRIMLGLGTLGGGNHFIELDRDREGHIWLVIHSGSRNFGLQVCRYHQKKAKESIKEEYRGAGAYHGMEYLTLEQGGGEYLRDMKVAQAYAEENRTVMARIIVEEFFELRLSQCERISSVHNYMDFEDRIVRKGAIAAHEGQAVIIPLNMRDGCLIARGQGNPEWNYSAPHGAGRLLKRSESKEVISLEDFQDSMKGIFSTCVSESTLDESPMAYKDSSEIVGLIGDTVTIESTMKPIYNFKA